MERRDRAVKTGKVKENAIRDNWDAFKRPDRERVIDRSAIRQQAMERQSVRQQVKEQARDTDRSARIERREQRRIERETRKPD